MTTKPPRPLYDLPYIGSVREMRNLILAAGPAILALALGICSAQAAPVVTANVSTPVTVPAGAVITATVTGGPGNRGDWVGVYAVGVVAKNVIGISWKWLSNDQATTSTLPLTGVKSGTVHLVAPTQPGQYEVRFFTNNSYTTTAKSGVVSINPLQVSVTGIMADCAWPPGASIATLGATGGNGNPVTFTFGAPAPSDIAIKGNTLVIGPTGITPANCHTIELFTINATQP